MISIKCCWNSLELFQVTKHSLCNITDYSLCSLSRHQNYKCKSFNVESSESGKWKNIYKEKIIARNQVCAIFRTQDILENMLPKFIKLCMEMPCWCPFEGHRYVYQKPTETFVFEFSYKCMNSLLKELIKVNILFWGKECSDSKIYRHRGFPCHQLMHCHTSYQSLTWAPIPMRPSLRHSIAYLYPCPTWPRTQLSGTYGKVQTYKKYMPVKVLLWSKFWLPFSFQL